MFDHDLDKAKPGWRLRHLKLGTSHNRKLKTYTNPYSPIPNHKHPPCWADRVDGADGMGQTKNKKRRWVPDNHIIFTVNRAAYKSHIHVKSWKKKNVHSSQLDDMTTWWLSWSWSKRFLQLLLILSTDWIYSEYSNYTPGLRACVLCVKYENKVKKRQDL